ncbi:MAG: hypothetical protein ACKVVT_08945 [Dehalococcoidia bacterium]
MAIVGGQARLSRLRATLFAPRQLGLDALVPPPPSVVGDRVGVEHEFTVRDAQGVPVDFAALLPRLAVPGRRLDPGDVHAVRTPSGFVVTADGREAEIATPPISTGPGVGRRVEAWSAAGSTVLRAALPRGTTLEGFSTHVSVSVPAGREDAIARRFARTFAPAYAAIAEKSASQGIYVRPRPGRLELCSDFVDGPRLEAAVAFAVAACRALDITPDCIPQLMVEIRPSRERFGHRVHRLGGGADAYAAPRTVTWQLAEGGVWSGQRYLSACAAAVAGHPGGRGLALALRMLRAQALLGVEGFADSAPRPGPVWSPHGALLDVPARDGLQLEAAAATWMAVLFRATGLGAGREAEVVVPGLVLDRFLDAFRRGRLSSALRTEIARAFADGTRLASFDPEAGVVVAERVDPRALVPAERPVSSEPGPRVGKASQAGAPMSRAGKRAVAVPMPRAGPQATPPGLPPIQPSAARPVSPVPPELPRPLPTPPSPRSGPGRGTIGLAVAGLALVAAAAAAGIGLLGSESDDGGPTPTVAAVTTATAASSTGQGQPSPASTAPTTALPGGTSTASATASSAAAQPGAVSPSPSATLTTAPTPTQAGPAATPLATPTGTTGAPSPTASPAPTLTPPPTLTPTATPSPSPRPTITPTPTPTPTPIVVPPTPTAPPPTETPTAPPPTETQPPTPCPTIPGTNQCL